MSVNGRPFKPDPTSYQMTGIPCGNPLRYKSRGVIRMTPNREIPFENQQIGIPGKGTESAAELECQNMLRNQLDSSASYAKKTLTFTSLGHGEVLSGTASGFLTLRQFQKVNEGDKESNQLRGLGFTDHQIDHLLTQKGLMDEDVNKLRKRKVGNLVPHPDFVNRGIDEMRAAKELKEAVLQAEANYEPLQKMSRHRAQLESAILQNKQHPLADIYHKKAMRTGGDDSNVTLEVVDSLQVVSPAEFNNTTAVDGADELPTQFSSKHKSYKIRTDQYRKHAPSSLSPPDSSSAPSASPTPSDAKNPAARTTPTPTPSQPAAPPKPVVLNHKIDSLAEDDIRAKKMPEEEILKLFPNYERGEPTKVLFVKNLDKDTGVEFLVSLFIRFQKEGGDKISFKLLTGRMKGQAFVTFHDEPTATAALELVHGFVHKDKPITIQYGKAK